MSDPVERTLMGGLVILLVISLGVVFVALVSLLLTHPERFALAIAGLALFAGLSALVGKGLDRWTT